MHNWIAILLVGMRQLHLSPCESDFVDGNLGSLSVKSIPSWILVCQQATSCAAHMEQLARNKLTGGEELTSETQICSVGHNGGSGMSGLKHVRSNSTQLLPLPLDRD